MNAKGTLQRLFSSAIFALISLVFGLEAADHSVVHDRSGNLRSITPPDLSAPRILQQPGARVAAIGDIIAWSVVPAGARPFSYQWQFNSNNIPFSNADTLLLTNISAASFGAYRVIVQNPAGS